MFLSIRVISCEDNRKVYIMCFNEEKGAGIICCEVKLATFATFPSTKIYLLTYRDN